MKKPIFQAMTCRGGKCLPSSRTRHLRSVAVISLLFLLPGIATSESGEETGTPGAGVDAVDLRHDYTGAGIVVPPKQMVTLRIPTAVPAVAGTGVEVSVELELAGEQISSIAFSIDFDETCLVFDPTDGDGDGIPDDVALDLPALSVTVDLTDADGEIDVVIWSPTALPSGIVGRIELTPACQPTSGSISAPVLFSRDPEPSFGSLDGQSVPGDWIDGSVKIRGPVSGRWATTGSMLSARWHTPLTLLPSGEVLVAGGLEAYDQAEIWDPATGAWTPTAAPLEPRGLHTSVLLPSGKVLVAGGWINGASLADAELYDPLTESWEETGSLVVPRHRHTGTLLTSGKVLVAGGKISGTSLADVELYDPLTGVWAQVGSLAVPREAHTATLLPSGEVLVVGGLNGVRLSSAELYDPQAGTWTTTGSLSAQRAYHTATLLPSGMVLVAGGENGGSSLASAELYDPQAGLWTTTGALTTGRKAHVAALLPSGKVLVAGGSGGNWLDSAEVYDPETGLWSETDPAVHNRASASAVVLRSGQVLIAGGNNNGSLAGAEIYDSADGGFAWTGETGSYRLDAAAALLESGKVLLVGGWNDGQSVEVYDPGSGLWTSTGSLAHDRASLTVTRLSSGKILATGGFGSDGTLASAELYDPVAGTWSPTGSLNFPRQSQTATRLFSGQVLVVGGHFLGPSAELYDPATGTWTLTEAPAFNRSSSGATLLPSGQVLLTGGGSDGPTSAELYDPATGTWTLTGSMRVERGCHTSTLLSSGKVLVAGGTSSGDATASAELYDPATGVWTPTGALVEGRFCATATLLSSGKVLVTGGWNWDLGGGSGSAELYDPATGTWTLTGDLQADYRREHTATLLESGAVLIAGGDWREAELYTTGGFAPERRPEILTAPNEIRYGESFSITGTGFAGDSEAGGGRATSSAVNYPLIQLQALDGGRIAAPAPEPRVNFSDDPMALTVERLPPALDPGRYLLTVATAGVPSIPRPLDLICSLVITAEPQDQVVALGESGWFNVESQGGRTFQWFKDGIPIPGATGASHSTPLITAADSGTTFHVVVDSGCMSLTSSIATLIVEDDEQPAVSVDHPDGGEFWLLSDPNAPPDTPPNTELVSWTMSDNIRICEVEVSLLHSADGESYLPAPEGGGLPATFPAAGAGGACPHPGESTSNVLYTLPEDYPSGVLGSFYKVQVRVTDQAGLVTAATSHNPFSIVKPDPDRVRTLILSHSGRLGVAPDLDAKLRELAGHPRVEGLVVDLAGNTDVNVLYDAWDNDPGDSQKANNVLFGCHPPLASGCPGEHDGVHDVVRQLLDVYSGVEYLILAGGDDVVPMARLADGTVLGESSYLAGGDLTAATTVGQALADDRYLSDDPLATLDPLRSDELDGRLFIPDLALGRLVEIPDQMIAAITTFIVQDGVLDLSARDHKVLVTGYDFLVDSGRRIYDRWQTAFPPSGDPLSPVDGALISGDWGVSSAGARRQELYEHLEGNGGGAYGIVNLNGHASHYQEGVPGVDRFDLQGLATCDLYRSDPADPSLDTLALPGSVVYAVGCHGGLPVPGGCGGPDQDPDRALDLPETMLALGVQAYVANTGYGWGLAPGVGYGERLVEILTEEMAGQDFVVVGEAVRRAKLRYFLEAPRLDAYGEKSLMQWAYFGFPMYAVRTGLAAAKRLAEDQIPFAGPPPEAHELGAVEQLGGVRMERRVAAKAASLPNHLTRLEAHFDLSAAGVYTKHDSLGDGVTAAGCPDPEGCYYALNGLSTGVADLPIQPYFVYDSRLAGTSQHGVLWQGGTYGEESGWAAVLGQLASNETEELSNHGSLPRQIFIRPRGGRRPTGSTPGPDPSCRDVDLDVSSVVVVTGEAVDQAGDLSFSVQRTFQDVDLEVLYYNNTVDGAGNCDRTGPILGAGPYHDVRGLEIDWQVPVVDSDVWRVVVVYNDHTVDAGGRGAWVPLELTDDDGDGTWTASHGFPGVERVTYVVQAVDVHGNVSWLDWVSTQLPASGVPLGVPEPVEVPVGPAVANLSVSVAGAPDPVVVSTVLTYTIRITNPGPDPATRLTVTDPLPEGTSYLLAGGDGWGCGVEADILICDRDRLEVGAAAVITLFVYAPAAEGTLMNQVCASAAEGEGCATEQTSVHAGADLAVTKSDGGAGAVPGAPLTYTIEVFNDGPQGVLDARVEDYFPCELADAAWTCVASPGSACGSASGIGDLVELVDLVPGGTVTYTATATVHSDTARPIVNTATVTLPAGLGDPSPSNNSSTVTTRAAEQPCPVSNDHLSLTGQDVDGAECHAARISITAGDGFHILAPGDVTFRAGSRVSLSNGFSVGSGAKLRIEIDPALLPD